MRSQPVFTLSEDRCFGSILALAIRHRTFHYGSGALDIQCWVVQAKGRLCASCLVQSLVKLGQQLCNVVGGFDVAGGFDEPTPPFRSVSNNTYIKHKIRTYAPPDETPVFERIAVSA